jgi:hypothetical protein
LNWNSLASSPWAVTIAGGVGVSLAGWLGRSLWKGRSPERETEKHSEAAVVQQTASPTVTQNFQPTITINQPPSAATAASLVEANQKTPSKDNRNERQPRIEYKGPREKWVYVSPHAISGITDPRDAKEREHLVQALVLRFENVPTDGIATRATSIVAKISFRSASGSSELGIDYGVWLNSRYNFTSMDVGDTCELVLICVMDNSLSSFDDRRVLDHDFRSEWSWVHGRDVDGLEMVEVRVIEKRTGASETFKFRIGTKAGHFTVAQLGAVEAS